MPFNYLKRIQILHAIVKNIKSSHSSFKWFTLYLFCYILPPTISNQILIRKAQSKTSNNGIVFSTLTAAYIKHNRGRSPRYLIMGLGPHHIMIMDTLETPRYINRLISNFSPRPVAPGWRGLIDFRLLLQILLLLFDNYEIMSRMYVLFLLTGSSRFGR